MSQIHGSLRLRPTRIGFLVNPSDRASVRRIMRYCTCLWGGQFNPIIPVPKRMPAIWREGHHLTPSGIELADGYLRFFEPDVIVEASEGLAASLGFKAEEFGHIRDRILTLDDFAKCPEQRRPELTFGLNVFDVYRHLYDREFKFTRRIDSNFVWFKSGNASAFIEAAYGMFPEDEHFAYIRKGYIDAFEASELPANFKSVSRLWSDPLVTPFQLCGHSLRRNYSDHWHHTIFVVDSKNTYDLIDLWNIRQFKSNVIPVDVDSISDIVDFLRDKIERNYRPLPNNPNGIMIRTNIQFGRSISKNRARSIVKKHFSGLPEGSYSQQSWYEQIWTTYDDEDYAMRPSRVDLEASTARPELSVPENKDAIRFDALEPEFASDYGNYARWANVLSLSTYGRFPDLAFTFPSNHKTPNFPHIGIGDPVIVSREGLVFLQEYKSHSEFCGLVKGRDSIVKWLKLREIEASPSEAGRIAEQIIASVGQLRDVSILADSETVKTLNKMASKTEEPVSPASNWKAIIHKRSNRGHFGRIGLEDLTRANVLRLGLAVDCPNCEKSNWFSLDELNYTIRCQRCLNDFSFPQGDFGGDNSSPWRYRVVGPFTSPGYAEGGYTTALSIRLFSELLGLTDSSTITYSTGLDMQIAGQKLEADFTIWYQRRRGIQGSYDEPVTLFGEAKSFADEAFRDKDVSTLKALNRAIPGSFLVFACLKKQLSQKEVARIAKLAEWGRQPDSQGRPRAPVIVLTGIELFSDWLVSRTWEDIGGQHSTFSEHVTNRLDNLWTLADCTQQLYLGLPPYHTWLDTFYKAKFSRQKGTPRRGKDAKNKQKK